MAIQLYSHNMQAYRAMLKILERNGKAAIIHPTGTGKSFIAFKWIEDHPQMNIAWLSPSDYIFNTQLENVRRYTPDFPVERITFFTYAKLMQLTEEDLACLNLDGIILDEFHRCGAKYWGEGVVRLLSMYRNAKLVGLSATKIRYLDGQRDMAEELFEGCVASEITLGEAVVRGILPVPKYVTTLYRVETELVEYQRRVDAIQSETIRLISQQHLDDLRRAVENADGLDEVFVRHITEKSGKYLVFCASRKHMQRIHKHAQEWFGQINPEMHCYCAYSADPETSRAYQAFVKDDSGHLKLLFSINMFNEGVHVPGISGVILFRPTVSPIIYKQQIGRALTTGVQHMPLILDVINNFDGLSSYGTIQAEMDDAVERLSREKREQEIIVPRLTVVEQMHDCVELFRKLESSLSSTWDYYFGAACAYRAQYGDLKVPRDYRSESGLCLSLWIQRQREAWKGHGEWALTQGQIDRLTQIGMVWESKTDLAWKNGFAHAQQYAEKFGDLDVPRMYMCEDGFCLGTWIHRLRQQKVGTKKRTQLTKERIEQIEALGMRWSLQGDNWELGYQEAEKFFEAHGHLDVPGDYKAENGFALCAWISTQRQAKIGGFGRKLLTQNKIDRLERIGMIWETRRERQWKVCFDEAKAYLDLKGHLRVPYRFQTESGLKLGVWLCKQRCLKKNENRNEEEERRYQLLESIGLFEVEDTGEHNELANVI